MKHNESLATEKVCPSCDGKGFTVIPEEWQYKKDGGIVKTSKCPDCKGKGQVPNTTYEEPSILQKHKWKNPPRWQNESYEHTARILIGLDNLIEAREDLDEDKKTIDKLLKKKGKVTFDDFLAQYGDNPSGEGVEVCDWCDGEGVVSTMGGSDEFDHSYDECPVCKGKGIIISRDEAYATASGTSAGAKKAWLKRKRGGGKTDDDDLQKQYDKLEDKINSLYDKLTHHADTNVEDQIDDMYDSGKKSTWSDKKLARYDKLKQKLKDIKRKYKDQRKEIDKIEKMQDKIQSRIDSKPDSDLNKSNRFQEKRYLDALNHTKFGEYAKDYMGGFKTVSVKGTSTKITMPKEKIRFGDHEGTMIFKIQSGKRTLEPHYITFNELSKKSRNNKTYQKIRNELTIKAKDLNQHQSGGVIDLTGFVADNFDVFYKHGIDGGIGDMDSYNQSSEDKDLAENWLSDVVSILGVDFDHIDPTEFVENYAPDLLEEYGTPDEDDYDDDDDDDDY